jgi:hypothetical protein
VKIPACSRIGHKTYNSRKRRLTLEAYRIRSGDTFHESP